MNESAKKLCQQCNRMEASVRVLTLKGTGYRWKCAPCANRTRTMGFKEKAQ